MITFNENEAKVGTLNPDRIYSLLEVVLRKKFAGDSQKQRIERLHNRFNFSCPICSDSNDPRKKRGNFYFNWLYFKCYNGGCEAYVDAVSFFKRFGVSMDADEVSYANSIISTSREKSRFESSKKFELSFDALVNTDFKSVLIKRDTLMDRLGLVNVTNGSQIGNYLEKRFQTIDDKFAWDPKKKRLFLFNTDSEKKLVLGLQIKPFDAVNAKYLTYNLKSTYEKLLGRSDQEFLSSLDKISRISTVFGLLTIDFAQTVTLFEGPMDHFLFPNSCAMCSLNNDWPFDTQNKRWFQDNDTAGRKKALEYIERGDSVFLWKKFLDESCISSEKKIKDLNDVVIYQKVNGKTYNLYSYFSTHQLDGVFI